MQLVALEVAAIALGLAITSGSVLFIVIAVAFASCLVLAVLAESGGRWWYQAAALQVGLRRRQRVYRTATPHRGPGVAPAAPGAWIVAPDLRVYSYDNRGDKIGIGQDRHGWYAAVLLGTDTDLLAGPAQMLRLDRVLRLLEEGAARPSRLQLTTLRVPAPTRLVSDRAECARSYLDLLGQVAHPPPAAAALIWLAVRLDPDDASIASAERGGGVAGVNRSLAAAVGRIGKLLGGDGIDYHVLDGEELRAAVDIGCGFDGAAPTEAGSVDVVERWRSWQVGNVAHHCFEVRGWPIDLDAGLLDRLATAPADQVVVSVIAAARGDLLSARTVVRITAPPNRVAEAAEEVRNYAAGFGVPLRPLHGLHASAAYASAPTGGGWL
ncbi:MAG TPA: type VII secretion protein EccE [Micromonosporaceae bacterium]|nr:type VII secretion protein EccE [Micromonosporaceae bacterium]